MSIFVYSPDRRFDKVLVHLIVTSKVCLKNKLKLYPFLKKIMNYKLILMIISKLPPASVKRFKEKLDAWSMLSNKGTMLSNKKTSGKANTKVSYQKMKDEEPR